MQHEQLDKYLPGLEVIWNALIRRDQLPENADVIVHGGCRDLGIAERAAEIYHSGICKTIIATGYQPKYLDIPEAELLANHCIKLGIPAEHIFRETKSTNTGENILLSSKLAKEAKSVILIHKPYMSLRFLATAEAQWPQPLPELFTTCQDISFEDYCKVHSLEKVAYMILGDMKRMKDYVNLGFQTPQYIPNEAYAAFEKLSAINLNIR